MKNHLRDPVNPLCGTRSSVFTSFAKKWKDVTCKKCMKTWEYKSYLSGKFKEKP
jgi:hypothetical protein